VWVAAYFVEDRPSTAACDRPSILPIINDDRPSTAACDRLGILPMHILSGAPRLPIYASGDSSLRIAFSENRGIASLFSAFISITLHRNRSNLKLLTMRTKSLSRLALTAAATLVATAAVTALPEAAHALTVTKTINGTSYDITTLTGRFDANQTTLTSTPWWGDSNLAQAFAGAVEDSLGLPQGPFAAVGGSRYQGPYFAYAAQPGVRPRPATFSAWAYFSGADCVLYPPGPATCSAGSTQTLTTTFATAMLSSSGGATPVPTPALLPGLVGMGIAAYRKRKLASSANA